MTILNATMPAHLCSTCKFETKCPIIKGVVDRLQDMEERTFEEHDVNLVTMIRIDECPRYRMDMHKASLLQSQGMITIEFTIDGGESEDNDEI